MSYGFILEYVEGDVWAWRDLLLEAFAGRGHLPDVEGFRVSSERRRCRAGEACSLLQGAAERLVSCWRDVLATSWLANRDVLEPCGAAPDLLMVLRPRKRICETERPCPFAAGMMLGWSQHPEGLGVRRVTGLRLRHFRGLGNGACSFPACLRCYPDGMGFSLLL